MSHLDNIGRVAQLCDLVSKPEWNDMCVVLESYNVEKDRYQVRVLSSPNENKATVKHLVKLSNIQFPSTVTFSDKFSGAAVHHVSDMDRCYEPGTIFHLDGDHETPETSEKFICVIDEDCRVIGEVPLSGEERVQIRSRVYICPSNSDTVVEISNIDFSSSPVVCINCGHITFLNCRFGGKGRLAVGDGMASSTVLLLSCTFDGINNEAGTTAIEVFTKSEVTAINCTFTNCDTGVRVESAEDASISGAIIKHCSFHNCPLAIRPNFVEMEIRDCLFVGCECAVRVNKRCAALVTGCRMQGCTSYAVQIHGPERSRTHIENCLITECERGIFVTSGKVKVNIVNSQITRNRIFGVLLFENVEGRVTISGCTIRNNQRHNILNHCSAKCTVMVNDIVQPDLSCIPRRLENDLLAECVVSADIMEQMRTRRYSARLLRTWKGRSTADEHILRCLNCHVEEPMEVKFRLCAKCENVAYCTKDCQVAHWQEHKKECGTVVYV